MQVYVKERPLSQGEQRDQNSLNPVDNESHQDGVKTLNAQPAQPPEKGSRPETWEDRLGKRVQLLANLVVVAGIFFALYQFNESIKAEQRRLAIEAVSQTRSADFLKAYADLKTAYRDGRVEGDPVAIRDDINFVMGVYDHVALLYISETADRCIIKNSVQSAVKDLLPVCDAMAYPKKYREHVDALLKLMERERCQ
jgi:hypothetical protein